jgi:hypothetical protein
MCHKASTGKKRISTIRGMSWAWKREEKYMELPTNNTIKLIASDLQ